MVDPCAPGGHSTDAGCASTFDGWSHASDLMYPRDHHVTFTGAGQLFVAGGFDSTQAFSFVESAPLTGDGGVGAFTLLGDLPAPMGGQGCVQTGPNTVVLVGGLNATSNSVTSTVVGQIDSSGMVTFTDGTPMNKKRYHVTASFHGGYVYAIGGLVQTVMGSLFQQSVSPSVERATFDGTTLGTWEQLADLPMPLTHHAAVVVDDSIYLIGGVTQASTLTQILRAPFMTDGTLGTFTQAGTLPAPRATSAAFYKNGYLYVVAGGTMISGGATASFMRAPIAADGSVGTFEMLMDLPIAREHAHHVPWLDGYVYSTGGSDSAGYQGAVFSGKFE